MKENLIKLAFIVLMVIGAYWWAYSRGVAHEHVKTVAVQGAFDAYVAQAKAQARLAKADADALRERWDGERAAAGAALAAAQGERDRAFRRLAVRAAADVPASPSGLGAAARVVMRDASAAANSGGTAEAAGAPARDPPAAETVSQRAVAEAWVAAADAYADAAGKHRACVAFYDALVAAQ